VAAMAAAAQGWPRQHCKGSDSAAIIFPPPLVSGSTVIAAAKLGWQRPAEAAAALL
jgi:hypothetical protein